MEISYIERIRIGIAFCVVMHGPCVQHNHGVFGDKFPLVGEILACDMRSPEPEWIMATFHLFIIHQNELGSQRVSSSKRLILLQGPAAKGLG